MNQYTGTNQFSAEEAARHHGNDAMCCSVCGEKWPCEAWLYARNKADRTGNRQTVIEVPVRGKRR